MVRSVFPAHLRSALHSCDIAAMIPMVSILSLSVSGYFLYFVKIKGLSGMCSLCVLGTQYDIKAIPATTTIPPIMLMKLILSPKITLDDNIIKNMHAPENTGYAMLNCMSLSAFVKNNTLIPPRTNPVANITNQKMLFCLFEMLVYKR